MDRTMHFAPGLTRWLACVALAVLVAAGALAPHAAQAQTNPMSTAQQQYDAAQFAEALATLQAALESGAVTGTDAVAARELLARCQAKTGNTAAAKKTFLLILRQDPQYRLDEVRTPPDEVAVFQSALSAFNAEQLHSQQRIPASLSTSFGLGSGANEDIGKYVAIGGGDKSFDNKPMFGIGVRFPVASKWSLDLELIRFRATNEDSVSGAAQAKYEITATPLVVNVVYLARASTKTRLNVFAGAGPMLNSYASDQFLFFSSITLKVTDTKVGTYFQGGLEGEYLLHPRLSVTGRALLRSAVANDVFGNSTFTQYGSGAIGDRKIDFSGYGVSLGLRGYIGY
ncbi:MAG: tetratricopeptide repeat protein [Candidatus Eisenbacteria bacterium]